MRWDSAKPKARRFCREAGYARAELVCDPRAAARSRLLPADDTRQRGGRDRRSRFFYLIWPTQIPSTRYAAMRRSTASRSALPGTRTRTRRNGTLRRSDHRGVAGVHSLGTLGT